MSVIGTAYQIMSKSAQSLDSFKFLCRQYILNPSHTPTEQTVYVYLMQDCILITSYTVF